MDDDIFQKQTMKTFYLSGFSSFRRNKNSVVLKCKLSEGKRREKCPRQVSLALAFYRDMFRLTLAPEGRDRFSDGVLFDAGKLSRSSVIPAVKHDKQGLRIKCGNMAVLVNREPFRITVQDAEKKTIFEQNVTDLTAHRSFMVPPIGYDTNARGKIERVRETISLGPEEHIFGCGEKFMPLDKSGRRVELWSTDPACVTTSDWSYKPVPFYLSTNGYGIFINSTGRIVYDFGAFSLKSVFFEIDSPVLDYFFIYGPSFKKILGNYTDLTGKPAVPPKWSFGLWMSRCMYRDRKETEDVVRKMKKNRIPFDVIHLDPLWLKNRTKLGFVDSCCEMEWDEKAFPKPVEFINRLHRQGIKVSLWENPYVHRSTSLFREGLKNKFFPAEKSFGKNYRPAHPEIIRPNLSRIMKEMTDGFKHLTLVDFSNPEAVKWYQEKHLRLMRMGVDVFKTDYSEFAPVNARYYNGMHGSQMHNLYPLLYNRTVFNAVKKATGRGMVWGRAGWAGIQQYPVQWGGDSQCEFNALAQTIRGGLSFGLSGCAFWSHDIGGFFGKPTPELYVRWAQVGMFCSHARCHGLTPREPWAFGRKAMKIFRKYAELRYRLIPYIYSYAFQSALTGLPVIRPLVLECQGDPESAHQDLEFFLGREILVAPVMNEENRRDVYLPEGRWIDFWSKKLYRGPVHLDYSAPLECLPLFIRGNSIIVYGPDRSHIENQPEEHLRLDIYLDSRATFNYYDDFEIIRFQGKRNDRKAVFTIEQPCPKRYTLDFNMMNFRRARVNGKPKSIRLYRNRLSLDLTASAGKTVIELF